MSSRKNDIKKNLEFVYRTLHSERLRQAFLENLEPDTDYQDAKYIVELSREYYEDSKPAIPSRNDADGIESRMTA